MSTLQNAAILFEPEGYVLDAPRLMGRQSAGNGFLRAAVAGLKGETVWGYTPNKQSGEAFLSLVQLIDPEARPQWLRADRLDILARIGTLYLPQPRLTAAGRMRLRAGVTAYSLVGITHTLASHTAMDAITELLSAPVMPWDALICTSQAALQTVRHLLRAEAEHLRWRLGVQRFVPPQLPVIPLGVHSRDFEVRADERHGARQRFGIADDEVVALFVGRLSFHAKAHPHAMYLGLQRAAETTGKKLVLLQCGRFASEMIERAFKEGAVRYCPSVRPLFVDGSVTEDYRQSWAASDIFVSLSDNLQETFGLTPIEAMAAGLPVVVTDWNGYRDTVRDGIDGFRIPTWMSPPGAGGAFATAYEAGIDHYDRYCARTARTVSVDVHMLADRLANLVVNDDLRRTLGASGQARAREVFDWSVVFGQYQTLWADLADMRAKARAAGPEALGPVPVAASGRMDPFQCFRHYPTRLLEPETLVRRTADASDPGFAELAADPLFAAAGWGMPDEDTVGRLLGNLGNSPQSCGRLAAATALPVAAVIRAVAVLAKMGIVRLDEP